MLPTCFEPKYAHIRVELCGVEKPEKMSSILSLSLRRQNSYSTNNLLKKIKGQPPYPSRSETGGPDPLKPRYKLHAQTPPKTPKP